MYRKKSYKSGRGGRVSIGRTPKLSGFDRATVRLERQQMDVRPMLMQNVYFGTAATSPVYSIAAPNAAGEFRFYSQPLYNLVNSVNYTTGISKMWNEYRLKKVTIHLCLMSLTQTTAATAFGDIRTAKVPAFIEGNAHDIPTFSSKLQNAIVISSWNRQSAYGAPAAIAAADLAVQPQAKVEMWTTYEQKPELWTQLTAGGSGESNWLSTVAAPAVVPNIKDFFDPQFNLDVYCGAFTQAETGAMQLFVEEEYIIECRGSKL